MRPMNARAAMNVSAYRESIARPIGLVDEMFVTKFLPDLFQATAEQRSDLLVRHPEKKVDSLLNCFF